MHFLLIYLQSRKAATSVEYALIIAGIALALSATIFGFGDQFASLFNNAMTPAVEQMQGSG